MEDEERVMSLRRDTSDGGSERGAVTRVGKPTVSAIHGRVANKPGTKAWEKKKISELPRKRLLDSDEEDLVRVSSQRGFSPERDAEEDWETMKAQHLESLRAKRRKLEEDEDQRRESKMLLSNLPTAARARAREAEVAERSLRDLEFRIKRAHTKHFGRLTTERALQLAGSMADALSAKMAAVRTARQAQESVEGGRGGES